MGEADSSTSVMEGVTKDVSAAGAAKGGVAEINKTNAVTKPEVMETQTEMLLQLPTGENISIPGVRLAETVSVSFLILLLLFTMFICSKTFAGTFYYDDMRSINTIFRLNSIEDNLVPTF